MSGPAPKPAGRRQRRNAPQLELVAPAPVIAVPQSPKPPTHWLVVTRGQWEELWASKLAARFVLETDLPALRRLFTLYDERERAYNGFRRKRVVKGSTGQPVLSPLASAMANFDKEIRALEDRFGLSPKSRLALGIQLAAAVKTLDEMNRDLEDPDGDDDPRDDA